jgi:aubergine
LIKFTNSTAGFKNSIKLTTSSNLSAIKLPKPSICFGLNEIMKPDKANFFVKGKIFDHEKANIDNWTLIYENDIDFCREFEKRIMLAARNMGVTLSSPKVVQLKHNKSNSLYQSISELLKKIAQEKPKIIVNLAEKKMEKEGYKFFKKICRENGLQSQQALVDWKKLEARGMVDNLTRQIAAKLGHRAWTVEKPLEMQKSEILMMIGADVYHKKGKDSVASVVATTDPNFSRFVSRHSIQPKKGQEVMTNIAKIVVELVQAFQAQNKRIPTTIVFYRDGVGKGQYEDVRTLEVNKINHELLMLYGENAPKMDFILVNKRINDRFYQDG